MVSGSELACAAAALAHAQESSAPACRPARLHSGHNERQDVEEDDAQQSPLKPSVQRTLHHLVHPLSDSHLAGAAVALLCVTVGLGTFRSRKKTLLLVAHLAIPGQPNECNEVEDLYTCLQQGLVNFACLTFFTQDSRTRRSDVRNIRAKYIQRLTL